MASIDSGATTYKHNGFGERVSKTTGSTTTLFVYGNDGELMGEYNSTGQPIQETSWFEGRPVATKQGSTVYYVHTDHLGTPRAVSDGNTIVWRWDSDSFGSTGADEDPDGNSTLFTYNLRFPGQYYDDETGSHYNYHRTLDPSTGRYLASDPIGLDGGLNTYGYVAGNPLGWIDPEGLAKGGKQNLRDTGLRDLTDEQLNDMARNGKTKADRRRAQREQKQRRLRNIRKRSRKGNLGNVRILVPLTIWDILQENCRLGLHTGVGCLPANDATEQNSCPIA